MEYQLTRNLFTALLKDDREFVVNFLAEVSSQELTDELNALKYAKKQLQYAHEALDQATRAVAEKQDELHNAEFNLLNKCIETYDDILNEGIKLTVTR